MSIDLVNCEFGVKSDARMIYAHFKEEAIQSVYFYFMRTMCVCVEMPHRIWMNASTINQPQFRQMHAKPFCKPDKAKCIF